MPYPFLQSLSYYIQPIMLFAVGVLYYLFKDDIIIDTKYGIISLIFFMVSILTGFSRIGKILFFPYSFICLIMAAKQCSSSFAKLGDISYGMYLVGFSVQQALVSLYGGSMPVYHRSMDFLVLKCSFSSTLKEYNETRTKNDHLEYHLDSTVENGGIFI